MQSTTAVASQQYSADTDLRWYRGYYRDRYRAYARSGAWGVPCSGCGAAVLVRAVGDRLSIMPVLCDSWACALCGTRRAAWLKRQIRAAVEDGRLCQFWTLTIRVRSAEDVVGSRALLMRAWNIVRTNLRRDYGAFSFVWTLERTARGAAHLHLLTSLAVSRADLSRRWRAATGGSWIVDVQGVDTARAGDYLAKYVTATASSRAPGDRSRVWSRSRDLTFEPFRGKSADPGAWVRWSRPYWDAVARLDRVAVRLAGAARPCPSAEFVAPGGLVAGVPAVLLC